MSPRRHIRQSRRGVVIVITLLALILLAALIMYVLNLGKQTNERIQTQNAADAAAAAGAGWIARSMNTVAMNNTGMAQMIAGINVLDSFPLAVDFSIKDDTEIILGDETAMYLAINHMLEKVGVPGRDEIFQRELRRSRDEIGPPEQRLPNSDEKMLAELNDWFKGSPEIVTNATHFLAPGGGNGSMWKALYSLDEYNQTVMENVGTLAQLNAIRGGEVNLSNDDSRSAAMMVPVAPQIPWVRGRFDDFERPVLKGLLIEEVDDRVTNRGPYDAVYGWRGVDRGSSGGAQWGDPPGWSPPRPANPRAYSVYGPHEWLQRHFGNTKYGRLPYHLRNIANIKISYLWPNKRRPDSDPSTLKRLVDPDWEIDIEADDERSAHGGLSGFEGGDQDDERMKIDEQGNEVPLCDPEDDGHELHTTYYEFGEEHKPRKDLHESLYMVLSLYHREKNTSFPENEKWPTVKPPQSSWFIAHNHRGRRIHPRYQRSWKDPSKSPPFGRMRSNVPGGDYAYEQLPGGRYAWRETADKQTNPNVPYGKYAHGAYPELSLKAEQIGVDDDGNPIYKAQPYYRTRYILLVGVNVGPEKIIRDPYIGFEPNDTGAPSPTDLNHQLVGFDDNSRWNYLTYMAIAQHDDRATVWPTRFRGNKPYPNMVGIAQAHVFNNHSWDMWTQMWHAQLQPVSNYAEWMNRMNSSSGDIGDVPELDSQEYEELMTYLKNLEPLAETMLSH